MSAQQIMIHFGELSTKGKNRRVFVDTLAGNIRHRLNKLRVKMRVTHDHIYLYGEELQSTQIIETLQDISGIHAISIVEKVATDTETLIKTARRIINFQDGQTFKVICHRKDKSYPLISDQINRLIAKEILENTSWTVDVHNPDFALKITIDRDAAYFITRTYPGLGGYPLGTMGRTLHMMSGGIDSPVAAYLLIRRGLNVEMLHFASPPYTQAAVIDKLKELLTILTRYQKSIKLHIVPFTELQLAIYQHAPEGYPITIMRRMMYRIATAYANRHKIKVLSTGECLGQVASQTIESLNVINAVCNLPVIRPLATFDKLNIIDIAKRIGTFTTSIAPYDDCCTIFAPKNPKTKPRIKEVEAIEKLWDYELQIETCLQNIETITIDDMPFTNDYL
ncbi:MAG: tRNA uracil 4-sulfurtransferase ThiI [Bacilli bacterium]|jgi:thiamine biosynthesis protein ThiI|nr:tRNA uracil 4-sulfurtransferase ThiI [Bacilli bacterium]